MTEAEWLTLEDPEMMLKWASGAVRGYTTPNTLPDGFRAMSDRKLRLFACGVARLLEDHPERRPVLEACEQIADDVASKWGEGKTGLIGARKSIQSVWGWTWAATCEDVTYGLCDTFIQMKGNAGNFYRQGEVASLLREIAGNPYRPVTLPFSYLTPQSCEHEWAYGSEMNPGKCGCEEPSIGMDSWPAGRRERQWACSTFYHVQDKKRGPCPWLTPQVPTLATAAYEERERSCDVCDGARSVREHRAGERRGSVCPVCQDSGTINDGTLDNFRLALVADALEEAGCVGELCDCTNDWCPAGYRKPHPILSHLRSPGPHVRGCWALDLLLNKE